MMKKKKGGVCYGSSTDPSPGVICIPSDENAIQFPPVYNIDRPSREGFEFEESGGIEGRSDQ